MVGRRIRGSSVWERRRWGRVVVVEVGGGTELMVLARRFRWLLLILFMILPVA